MTHQYVYTEQEHCDALMNKAVADILKQEIEKGSFYYFGKVIKSIDDFIITNSMLNGHSSPTK